MIMGRWLIDRCGRGYQGNRPNHIHNHIHNHTHAREYLTGFGKRKQERRRFGLAMQRVKDRKARLADREEVGPCGGWCWVLSQEKGKRC